MNVARFKEVLSNYSDDAEVKAIKEHGSDEIKIVVIEKEKAVVINEILDIQEDPQDMIALGTISNEELLSGHETFPEITVDEEEEIEYAEPDSELYPEGRDFDDVEEEHLNERDEEDREEEGFVNREMGLEGEDRPNIDY